MGTDAGQTTIDATGQRTMAANTKQPGTGQRGSQGQIDKFVSEIRLVWVLTHPHPHPHPREIKPGLHWPASVRPERLDTCSRWLNKLPP